MVINSSCGQVSGILKGMQKQGVTFNSDKLLFRKLRWKTKIFNHRYVCTPKLELANLIIYFAKKTLKKPYINFLKITRRISKNKHAKLMYFSLAKMQEVYYLFLPN